MTNLEKMKQELIKQIEKMDVESFENLCDVLQDNEDLDIDGSILFDCKTCVEKYGECSSNINCSECSERFERYCREDI